MFVIDAMATAANATLFSGVRHEMVLKLLRQLSHARYDGHIRLLQYHHGGHDIYQLEASANKRYVDIFEEDGEVTIRMLERKAPSLEYFKPPLQQIHEYKLKALDKTATERVKAMHHWLTSPSLYTTGDYPRVRLVADQNCTDSGVMRGGRINRIAGSSQGILLRVGPNNAEWMIPYDDFDAVEKKIGVGMYMLRNPKGEYGVIHSTAVPVYYQEDEACPA